MMVVQDANPAVVPGRRPAAGVELVTHHHQQGLPSTGPTAVRCRRLQRHAQTQLTQVQQVQLVQAAVNGEYERGGLEVGELFRAWARRSLLVVVSCRTLPPDAVATQRQRS